MRANKRFSWKPSVHTTKCTDSRPEYNTHMLSIDVWIIVTVVGLILLLAAERRGATAQRIAFKVIASTAFILTALSGGALASRYGLFILTGLALSWFGDVFLLWRHPLIFQAGLVSFLLAHVTYIGAFLSTGPSHAASGVALLCCGVVIVLVVQWIRPHLTTDMRYPVMAYITVISGMVVFAAGAAWSTGQWVILAGAVMFYLSDIAVARDRFVAPGFANSLWGLPLYYGGQLLLAYSVSLAGV